jgi:hypothetical protein
VVWCGVFLGGSQGRCSLKHMKETVRARGSALLPVCLAVIDMKNTDAYLHDIVAQYK